MNSENFWNQLVEAELADGTMPITNEIHIPWYIRFMQGFAGWLAALFLLGFFGTAFSFLFHKPTGGLLISVGILCSVGAYVLIKFQRNDFFDQLGMAFSLCGQLMVAIGLFFLLKVESKVAFFILGIYQLTLAWLVPQYGHRVLTTSFGLLAVLIGLNLSGFYAIGSAVIAIVLSFIWLKEKSWGRLRNIWEPIGYGVAITIVFSSGFLISGKFFLRESIHDGSGWLFEQAELINSVLIALVFVNLVVLLLKENKVKFDSKTAVLSYVMAIGLVLISFKIYGISTGLLLLIIGFSRQRISLIVLGGFAIVSFFSWYYYNLQATLLFKSVTLVILGVCLLLGKYILSNIYKEFDGVKSEGFKLKKIQFQHVLVLVTVVVVLIAINININKKENLITNGEKLIFPLAPVDPRSLMQGDYMRLRFELADDIQKRLRLLNNTMALPVQQGFVVVEKSDKGIVTFVDLFHNQDLKNSQRIIPYKYRNYRVIFTTDAFYFEEGQARHFQKAKFGEFRYSKDGELILVHLLDKDFKVL
jgi:uncharacterized membrane-anchored protein